MSLEIITGDCRAVLATMAPDSVHCVVTSPPYHGLRDYQTGTWEGGDPACEHKAPNRFDYAIADKQASHGGSSTIACYRDICGKCGARRVDQQIGLEETPEQWCARLVEVFREVRRVLRPDGTLWLNVGDSYNNFRAQMGPGQALHGRDKLNGKPAPLSRQRGAATLKEKDLVGQPWLLAFALRADGWYLRSEIIWSKPNPMPESVRDRPTKAHEQVFLLTKSGETTYWAHRDLPGTRTRPEPDYRWIHKETGEEVAEDPGDLENWKRINLWSGRDYFYDQEAVREPSIRPGDVQTFGGAKARNGEILEGDPRYRNGSEQWGRTIECGTGRNMRSVWTIATEPFAEAHFATFPTELARRCILAGTSAKGCCPECGAPWQRVVERERGEAIEVRGYQAGVNASSPFITHGQGSPNAVGFPNSMQLAPRGGVRGETLGWSPTCGCSGGVPFCRPDQLGYRPHQPIPCTALDPFGGSGTTGLVAEQLGRDAILIELNPQYAEMAQRRIDHARARRAIGDVTERFQPLLGQQELPL